MVKMGVSQGTDWIVDAWLLGQSREPEHYVGKGSFPDFARGAGTCVLDGHRLIPTRSMNVGEEDQMQERFYCATKICGRNYHKSNARICKRLLIKNTPLAITGAL